MRLLHISVPDSALFYLSWVGIFVLSVGLCCTYGARLMACSACSQRIETVWLLTAIPRALVSVFLLLHILLGDLTSAWITIAIFDGLCAIFQAVALKKGWLNHVAR